MVRKRMRITKVTTRRGDQGSTSLADGTRVPKDHPRLETCGTVDELSSAIGLALSLPPLAGDAALEPVCLRLRSIQNHLLVLGGELASPPAARPEGLAVIGVAQIEELEGVIATFNANLPPLEEFLLPGPPPPAAALHLARCICRRAERRTRALAEAERKGSCALPYLNRLSDALFVLARWITREAGHEEPIWQRSDRNPDPPEGEDSDAR